MLFSTTCKQGKLQLTEDGFLSVVSLFGGQPAWREHAQSIRAFDVKPGAMASCGIVIHATQDRLVTMVVQKDFDRFRQLFPAVPVNQVAELVVSPPAPVYQQPTPPHMYQQPSDQFAPQAYPQPMQPVYQQPPAAAPMETTVKSYKTPKDYQRDLKRMQRGGWEVQNTLDHHQNRSLGYKLFVPFGAFSAGTDQIVVTYQRQKR